MRSTGSDADLQNDTLTASMEYERNGFHCVVTVSWQNENNNDTTEYNMFAYSGIRSFGGFLDAHVETCGVTSYKPPDVVSNTVGGTVVYYNPPKNLATIRSISIVARTPDVGTLPIPITMDTHSYPLTTDFYTFSKRTTVFSKQKMLEVKMELSKPVNNLITFGIYKLPDGNRSNSE